MSKEKRMDNRIKLNCFQAFIFAMIIYTTSYRSITTNAFTPLLLQRFSPTTSRRTTYSHFHHSTKLNLNRFLLDSSEVQSYEAAIEKISESTTNSSAIPISNSMNNNDKIVAVLSKNDYRTIHAAKILNLQNGDSIRAGIVSSPQDFQKDVIKNGKQGYLTESATISWIPEGKIKKAQPTKNGDPPGSLFIELNDLVSSLEQQQQQKESSSEESSSSSSLSNEIKCYSFRKDYSVSLILALPRPLQLNRILPMISQLGVEHLVLTTAKKVPKDYFGSHLFRKPSQLQDLLIEGLCQAGDVNLPNVHVVKSNFQRNFCENGDLDRLFPKEEYARVISHPFRTNGNNVELPTSIRDVQFPNCSSSSSKKNQKPKIVLAVGPEGE